MHALGHALHPPYLPDSWHEELRGLVRAFSGAFLFGVPLLYTMEMWWLGDVASPRHLALTLVIALVANFGLVTAAGFKEEKSLFSRVEQTMDAVAVGAVGSAIVLLTLNQLNVDQSPLAMFGKIVIQTLPLSIGASLANIVFSRDKSREGEDEDGGSRMSSWPRALFNDFGATAIGAAFIASNVAPTEEIPMLASRLGFWHQLALIGLTILTGYVVVFASGFDPAAKRDREHLFQHPATETILSYLVSLIVAFGVLALMKQIGAGDPPAFVLTQTLVLGLPAMVGGAAGRIAV